MTLERRVAVMEDFNNWVMTIAGYITVTEYTVKFLLK